MLSYVFMNASTAVNFVTSANTEEVIAWKTKDGKSIKDILL